MYIHCTPRKSFSVYIVLHEFCTYRNPVDSDILFDIDEIKVFLFTRPRLPRLIIKVIMHSRL